MRYDTFDACNRAWCCCHQNQFSNLISIKRRQLHAQCQLYCAFAFECKLCSDAHNSNKLCKTDLLIFGYSTKIYYALYWWCLLLDLFSLAYYHHACAVWCLISQRANLLFIMLILCMSFRWCISIPSIYLCFMCHGGIKSEYRKFKIDCNVISKCAKWENRLRNVSLLESWWNYARR